MKSIQIPITLTGLQPLDFPHKLGICERLFGKVIAQHGIAWVQTAAGITWKLDLALMTHRWIVYGKYEGAPFLNWARRFLPVDGIIVDSGSNIGQMLLYLAQWVPQGKVLAFEPGIDQADWLEECLTINATLPVELIRCALGQSATQKRLSSGGSQSLHGYWSNVSETEGEPIQVVRLADELESRGIEKIDLWKLDVEGYEIQAMQGVEKWIEEQKIKAIYAELIDEDDRNRSIRDYLAQFGYHCYLFNPRGKLFDPLQVHNFKFPRWTNGLFLPVKSLEEAQSL